MRTFLCEGREWRGRALSGRELLAVGIGGAEGEHRADAAGFEEPLAVDVGRIAAEGDDAARVQLEDLGRELDAVAAPDARIPIDGDGQAADAALFVHEMEL